MKSPDLCVLCKGTKKLCGLPSCPLLNKIRIQTKNKQEIKEDVFGPSSEVFVGTQGYPEVFVGPMVSTFEKALSPDKLYGMKYEEIIEDRVQLLRGKKRAYVSKRIEDNMKEVALSTRSTDVEMNFTKKPYFDVKFSSVLEPMGGSAPIKNYKIAENPKIPKRVDSILEDNIKAAEAIDELYSHGFDNYYLSKILSVGVLGKEERKRIVPTRWSITALDDIIGKQLIERIRTYPQVNEIRVFYNEFLHNHFEVLMIPGNWEFENFECWSPKSIWAQGAKEPIVTQEHELFWGKKGYAESQRGGYYASRTGVVEYLNKIRKQARVIVFREIGEEYMVPVGVWEVRENSRHALMHKGKKFGTIKEALEDISTRLRTPIEKYLEKSRSLKQKRLVEYF